MWNGGLRVSAYFNLTLDTHAPQVTWGEATGVGPGELLHVPFELDEPAMQSATIRLADGQVLTMAVVGSELQVELPLDTPDGNALISAIVRDDVWNQATVTSTVRLTGIILPPPPPPDQPVAPGHPSPDRLRGPARRLVQRRSAATASSSTTIRVQRRQRSTAGTSTVRRVDRIRRPAPPAPMPVPPGPVAVHRRAVAHFTSRRDVAVRSRRNSPATLTSSVTVRKRDDEALLEALGII